ncbi:MAG: hypothetical protein LBV45_00305 [Xanthomonadaceae bacterium]|nr:hypothetical protein [Xanthomonadaceae bacterium]
MKTLAASSLSMAARIAHLSDASWQGLKQERRCLFGNDPPVSSRRLVEKWIAYTGKYRQSRYE